LRDERRQHRLGDGLEDPPGHREVRTPGCDHAHWSLLSRFATIVAMSQASTLRERRHVDLRRQASAICGLHG
jgi:hypothetical protein